MSRVASPKAEELDPANTLGALALAVTDGMLAEISGTGGLHQGDAIALNAIGFRPGCSVRDLAGLLDLSHPGAVRCVDRLVAAGLIDRARGPNERTVALQVTPAGAAKWKVLRDGRMRWLNRLLKVLPGKDRRSLAAIAGQLLDNLAVDEARGERICRLCDENICTPSRCPITDDHEAGIGCGSR